MFRVIRGSFIPLIKTIHEITRRLNYYSVLCVAKKVEEKPGINFCLSELWSPITQVVGEMSRVRGMEFIGRATHSRSENHRPYLVQAP